MVTYKNTDYETSEDLRAALNSELSVLAYPFEVKHKTYGEGQLTFVKAPLSGGSLYATVDFAVGTKTLSIDVILAADLLEMPEILMDILLEAQTAFKEDFEIRRQEELVAMRQRLEQTVEAAKQAAKEKKNKKKTATTQDSDMNKETEEDED